MPASWYQPMGVDAPNGDVDDKGEKASFKKGAEDRPRNPLLSRSHRPPGEGQPISEEDIARRLSSGVVGGRDRGVESLTSTRCVIANSVLGQGAPEVHTSAPFLFANFRTLAPSHGDYVSRRSEVRLAGQWHIGVLSRVPLNVFGASLFFPTIGANSISHGRGPWRSEDAVILDREPELQVFAL